MIELLKDQQIYERTPDPNNPLSYTLSVVATAPPNNKEIKDKINEIIEYLNRKESINFMF